ncbi:aldehyde dehydrogenase (NADP(+)) [Jiangella alkaliphila]|uniref:NADP-dependent aldehyde dehydrogenase n=1 Tax=Jiangella alkaliphila TaxID=419479 RepID=A0A1H2LUD7_9ACTN|nr:aldehyde dehydrogenase (NADP(+)) [Jiangella alkaliphila]SDU84630.1 NADP-dependent aldehyde dehydrogenase [Jiangella alkaliphila]
MSDVDHAVGAAAEAAVPFEQAGRAGRADALEAVAAALEDDRDAIVSTADTETGLGATRLNGELTRTTYQLRLFGEVLREGSYVEATVDHAGDTPMGPKPDLRRMLVPVGVVGVFGASNFPLAFSVPGGDTASALAAGCPVVVKAHPSHPETSRRTFAAMRAGLAEAKLPEGTLGLIEGLEAGAALVQHPDVRAVGFTGSTRGGRALADLAAARPRPIPFYGELGSLNPLVVTPEVAAGRAQEFAAGYVGSITMGVGQFCTKPGLLFAPAGAGGDELRAALGAKLAEVPAGRMLNDSIRDAFQRETERRRADARLRTLGDGRGDDPALGRPVLLAVSAADLSDDLLEETFGPAALVIEYRDTDELLAALDRLEGQLTATVHAADDETELVDRLHATLRQRAGRLLFGGFPTGVAVTWAMQHGGPYPSATLSTHTSVGPTSIRRWLRPIAYQNAPEHVLPEELRDANPGIPRRVDGILRT